MTNEIEPGAVGVFLGPSLGVNRAREILEARYLPPARRGDVYRLMTSGVETIVLIDGVFHNTPSVWQRELLDAIEDGIRVFGASSMGALRAAELHGLGMQGFGVVFEWYRDLLIEGDDEVALLHASEEFNYRGLSVPLVNIRYTLAQAVKEGQLNPELERGLLEYVKSIPYPSRTFEAVLDAPILNEAAANELAVLKNYLATKRVDIKKQDAIGVLQHVKALLDEGKVPDQDKGLPDESKVPDQDKALPDEGKVPDQDKGSPGNDKVPNQYKGSPVENIVKIHPALAGRSASTRQQFDRASMTRFYSSQGTFDGAELLERAQANAADVASLRAQLSARRFIREWAFQNQRSCPDEVLQKLRADFLEKIHDLPSWLRANGLTFASFRTLLDDYLLIDWLESQAQTIFNLNGDEGDAPDKRGPMIYFILDWAKQNGVTAPEPLAELDPSAEPLAEPDPHTVDHLTPAILQQRRELAFAKWIVAQEPPYFGIEWRFELDLLRWLQINGRAAEVYSQNQTHAAEEGTS